MLKSVLQPRGLIGFLLACAIALWQGWTVPEFCWSTWLAGLVYAWSCVFTAAIHLVLTARAQQAQWRLQVPQAPDVPRSLFVVALGLIVAFLAAVAFYAYGMVFAFYGLFLSVFAEMPPLDLFGRNGFINSDFYTPVAYLLMMYWPMTVGTLVAYGPTLVHPHPWRRLILPMEAEVVRLHVLILALPLLSLLAWALLGEHFQPVAVVLMMAVFYFGPGARPRKPSPPADPEAQPQE